MNYAILQSQKNMLICYLNDFPEAKKKLQEAKPYLKQFDSNIYQQYKETTRILRKVKYS